MMMLTSAGLLEDGARRFSVFFGGAAATQPHCRCPPRPGGPCPLFFWFSQFFSQNFALTVQFAKIHDFSIFHLLWLPVPPSRRQWKTEKMTPKSQKMTVLGLFQHLPVDL